MNKEDQNTEWKESWGRGIETIINECKSNDVPEPVFDNSLSGIMLTFQANQIKLKEVLQNKKTAKLGDKLGKNRLMILNAMSNNPTISIPELSQYIGISSTAIEKNIKFLKDHHYISREGPAKGGHWVILENNNDR